MHRNKIIKNAPWFWVLGVFFGVLGCGEEGNTPEGGGPTLTLGAYTTPREVYGKEILPAFKEYWKNKTGQEVTFKESYLGSGAQARAIVGGFDADIAALSLEADIEVIKKEGLIRHDWKKEGSFGGMVSHSIVVIGVRKGNPKNIKDWDDLARPGLAVLTPNVRTSGGAQWNIAAIYGAALRGHTSAPAGDAEAAIQLLSKILCNVSIMDRGARDSMLNFERGVGDAIITYENEILVGQMKGQDYEYVIPKSTILIENPVAVVDAYAERHQSLALAKEFVSFLWTPEVQRAYAKYGLRPVHPEINAEFASKYPPVTDLFTVRDLGDWPGLQESLFDKGAGYDRALAASQAGCQ